MYALSRTIIFTRQYADLGEDTCAIIEQKLQMAQTKPSHFKHIYRPGLVLFSIRFSDRNKDKRLIYNVEDGVVKVLFILDRGKGYADLEHWLKKVGY